MKRSAKKMIHEFRVHWKNYVLQCLLATAVIFIVILCLGIDDDAVITASIGATTFIVFAMPNSVIAKGRNVIGGQLVGLACGYLMTLVPAPGFVNAVVAQSLVYALAVGLSIFIMVVTDTEHPPAAATALGIVIRGFSSHVVIAVIASSVILSLMRRLCKSQLKDLT